MSLNITGTFGATGRSNTLSNRATLNTGKRMALSLSGTFVATVTLDRSYDAGATWHIIESYTAATEVNVETPSDQFTYSLNCSAFTSGTVTYFMAK
jgi:hypothetical protein